MTPSTPSPMLDSRPSAKVLAAQTPEFVQSPSTISLLTILTIFGAAEFLAVAVTAYTAILAYYYIAFHSWFLPIAYIFWSLYLAALNLLTSVLYRHYDDLLRKPRHVFLWNGILAVGISFSIFVSTMFFMKASEEYSRGSLIFQIISATIVVLASRSFLYSWLRSLIKANRLRAASVVLVGDPLHCAKFANRLKENGIHTSASYRLSSQCEAKGQANSNNIIPISGHVQAVIESCRYLRPDHIIALLTRENTPEIITLSKLISELPIGLHVVPITEFEVLEAAPISEFGNLQTMLLRRPPLSAADRFVKRAFDICAATAGLILCFPLFLIVSIAIIIDSRGPVFFRQTRHGFNNDTIRMFKFRTMSVVEDGHNFTQATKNDVRVTRVGQILRYTSIDELPQLLNVLCGDMSIVGPRPHPTALNETFKEKISPFLRRHTVKPGITGWAQVNGFRGPTDTLEKMRQRIEHDIYYVDHWSFLFDIKIIIMTLFTRQTYLNAL